jgi:FMN phosphatase YigB (HAD superfamily)
MQKKTVLIDIDGTLISKTQSASKFYLDLCSNLDQSNQIGNFMYAYERYRKTKYFFDFLSDEFFPNLTPSEIRLKYYSSLSRHCISNHGIIDFILNNSEVRFICVTSGTSKRQEYKLNILGIIERFERIITFETFKKTKSDLTFWRQLDCLLNMSISTNVYVIGDNYFEDIYLPKKAFPVTTIYIKNKFNQSLKHADFSIEFGEQIDGIIEY